MRKKQSDKVEETAGNVEHLSANANDSSVDRSKMILIGITLSTVLLYTLSLCATSVRIHTLSDEVTVDEYGYITIHGYTKAEAEGARVFISDDGVVIAPVSSSIPVLAIKSGPFGKDIAYGIVGPGSNTVSPSVSDTFVDGVVKVCEDGISPQYRNYFKDIAKVYRDVQSKHLSTDSEITEALARGVRDVLGFNEPERDSAMEAEFQSFFGSGGAFTNYVESSMESPYKWDDLLIQCATAFERVK